MEGWLVVVRYGAPGTLFADTWSNSPEMRQRQVGVLNAYRGVDGHTWFGKEENDPPHLTDGLASPDDFAASLAFFDRVPFAEPFKDIVYAQKRVRPVSTTLPNGFGFLGFDFAVLVFSSLYHEVVWGNEREMHAFAERLNVHLLCDSLEDVAKIQAVRNGLLLENPEIPSLETACTPQAIAIYGRPRTATIDLSMTSDWPKQKA